MEAYLDGWKRIYCFNGVSTRSQFWIFKILNSLLIFFVLFVILITRIVGGADSKFLVLLIVALLIFGIFYWLASWTITVRRLHDIGKSGMSILLGLIPVLGGFILFIFYLLPSKYQ